MLFACAIRILSSIQHRHLINITDDLLRLYVENFTNIYGKSSCSYNIHNLLHLANDSKMYGTVDEFSCFDFESKLGWMKSIIKSGYKPLQQVAKRVESQCNHELSKNNINGSSEISISKFISGTGFSKIELKKFYLQAKTNNQWFSTNNPFSIISFKYVKYNDKHIIYGCKLKNMTPMFKDPIDSSIIDLYISDGTEDLETTTYEIEQVYCKLFRLEINKKYAFFPLIHSY